MYYTVGFNSEIPLPMTLQQGEYVATIPASAFAAGRLVRWYVTAEDANGALSRQPAYNTPDDPQYLGTVIVPTNSENNTGLPTMEWFAQDPWAAQNTTGSNGTAIYFLDHFYDNVFVKRKGVTSLSWAKPKLKFKFHEKVFVWKENLDAAVHEKPVDEFDINSLYWEPGQKSYMREHVGYEVLKEAGAPYNANFYFILRLNNAYWGLALYVEVNNNGYLARNNMSTDGLLFKAVSGTEANLRWDLPEDQLQYSFKKENQKKNDSWPLLYTFSQGISGGSNEEPSLWVFDNVDLPPTIDQLAVNAMLLNQDRCTKNYLIYDSPEHFWTMISYDQKSTMAGGGTPPGAAGTFNYLVNLIMEVPATRQMFMRRLRTLMDQFLDGGRLLQIINETYTEIKPAADYDNTVWHIGSIDDGYQALITEQLPQRKQQLYGTYGPNGSIPLIPEAQSPTVTLGLGRTQSSGNPAQQFVEITNTNAAAVDVSSWQVSGAVTATLQPGTVISGGSSLILVSNLLGFAARTASPMPGQGLQIQQAFQGSVGANGIIALTDTSGRNALNGIAGTTPNVAG
ncbi:hypothetical protein WJX73_004025 [Symbiochloris irregularis]|uniref:LTD domain-containing protein n=1 Tax=Symbiochloris irregularis TaxID=706552 RepID=A0AAW1PR27_9CHLO